MAIAQNELPTARRPLRLWPGVVIVVVQWLGWFGQHQPPAEHATDWLAEAVRAVEWLRPQPLVPQHTTLGVEQTT